MQSDLNLEHKYWAGKCFYLCQSWVGAAKLRYGDVELVPSSLSASRLNGLSKDDISTTVKLLLRVLDSELEILRRLQ